MNGWLRLAFIVVAVTAPETASAHVPVEGASGVYAGILHPYVVPAHALSLAALGLFIAKAPHHGAALLIYAAALVSGLVALTFAVGETPAGDILVGNTGLIGVLLALDWAPPRVLLWLLAAIGGAALALDSPPETTSLEEAHLMLLGTGIGALSALGAVVGGALHLTRPWQRLGMRIAGSWIAASAILVLALALAR
jgi:urease accessory protein